jgi:hypothetical protein
LIFFLSISFQNTKPTYFFKIETWVKWGTIKKLIFSELNGIIGLVILFDRIKIKLKHVNQVAFANPSEIRRKPNL